MSRQLRARRRDRLAGEERRLPPAPGGSPDLLVIYPNVYAVGMANLGFHAVLETLIGEGAAVDRAFLPEPAALEEHRRSGGVLRSLDSQRPLSDFAALLFSVSFEPDLVGLVQMLELGGLPPLTAERCADAPLVIAGGLAASLNPEPLAPFVDLVGSGEAEALLPSLLPLLREARSRGELLEGASALPGWYATRGGPQPVRRQWAPLSRPCAPVVLAAEAAFAGHVDLEISRGCQWRCRFCAAGHVVTPYREHAPAALEELIAWGLNRRGRIGLVGTDVSDHGHLLDIAERVWRLGGEVALPSLRVESLRPGSAAGRLIAERPPHSLTLAVEAGCESLRHGLGKRLSDDKVRRAVQTAARAGVHKLRLYFLVGIPGELPEEVEAIATLATELQRIGPAGGLELSVTGLVPGPRPEMMLVSRSENLRRALACTSATSTGSARQMSSSQVIDCSNAEKSRSGAGCGEASLSCISRCPSTSQSSTRT
jgi:radical SAM superfamily enzyme YgiQ (UPF0313 family)